MIFAAPESQAYMESAPLCRAQYKCAAEDFQVDETLGFMPSGAGEHLFLHIQKTNMSTIEVSKHLTRELQVKPRDIGYSGMKDKRAVSSQWFSVKLPVDSQLENADIESTQLEILQSERNQRKLKIGSHKNNRFKILLRNIEGESADIERRLQLLQKSGVPNYFGSQRFGHKLANLQQLQTLLDSRQSPAKGGRERRSMLFSAARAYVFNQLLSKRLQDRTWNAYVPGDVLNLAGTQRSFVVEPNAWDETLQQRLAEQDIHISGPLAGTVSAADKYVTSGQSADIENGVLNELAVLVQALQEWGLQAARRPLRFRVDELQWHWLDATSLQLQFCLPRGAYATSLLRELCQLTEAAPHASS